MNESNSYTIDKNSTTVIHWYKNLEDAKKYFDMLNETKPNNVKLNLSLNEDQLFNNPYFISMIFQDEDKQIIGKWIMDVPIISNNFSFGKKEFEKIVKSKVLNEVVVS